MIEKKELIPMGIQVAIKIDKINTVSLVLRDRSREIPKIGP